MTEEQLNTLRRAKKNGITSIWSGDLRNPYLRETLQLAVNDEIVDIEPYDNPEAQESGYNITWLKETF